MAEQSEIAARIMDDISRTAERLARRMGGEFVPFDERATAECTRNNAHPLNHLSTKRS